VGNDDFGHLNIERLRADGVDVSAIHVHDEAVTGSAFVRYRQDGQRDFVFNIRHSACGEIAMTARAEALIAEAGHLHIMGSSLFSAEIIETIRRAIERVKASGGSVSFDPNIRKEMLGLPGMRDALMHVLAHTDLFLPSGSEIFLFSETNDEAGAIADILARGVKTIVVKRGAEGASFHDGHNDIHVPAFQVEEIDPTGAGDAFGATFITAWLRGLDPRDSLRAANAAGALAVQVKGPMEGTSSWHQIDKLAASAASTV
jgi:sugar/nucleoside kinase (ribokinase family)